MGGLRKLTKEDILKYELDENSANSLSFKRSISVYGEVGFAECVVCLDTKNIFSIKGRIYRGKDDKRAGRLVGGEKDTNDIVSDYFPFVSHLLEFDGKDLKSSQSLDLALKQLGLI